MVRLCGFCKIGGKHDDARVRFPCLNGAFAEALARTRQIGFLKNIRGKFCVRVDHMVNWG